MTFDDILEQVITLLKRQGRVSYRALKMRFEEINDDYLDVLKEEILYVHESEVQADDRGFTWTGETDAIPEPTPHLAQPATQSAVDQALSASVESSPTNIPEAERRQLTVMFVDLVDSTRLSSELDPEIYRDIVREYQTSCSDVIAKYDGNVAQLLGDGLLVYFGYPVAHEDDAQRSVRTGLGIIEAIGALNTRLERDKGVKLAVRLGIHTGLVVVGEMGGSGRQEQLALGETPNIAARIQGLAEPNTVVISDVTYRLIQGFFDVETLGEHELRGVAQPMAVYRVLRESGAQSRLEVASTHGLTPLIGRESETALLLERWAQAKDGSGQVGLVSGEAGIGKSRLIQVLKDHVADEPHTRMECRSLPYFTNSALYPITEFLQRTLRFQTDDTPEEKLDKLEQNLRQYSLPLEETVPLFGNLLSLALPEDQYPPLNWTPQRQRQKTLEAIVAITLELAERQPVLFILEDAHWQDPSTNELLGLLMDQTPTVSLLLLITCRPEFQPSWSHRSYLTEMTLNRLSRHQVEQLTTQVAGGKTLPDEVIAQLVDRTDGVPLYVEEMTKSVLESGVLKKIDEHYELTGAMSSLTIPATLQDSLMARLDRLVTAKAVAQYASVIGRQFSYALLREVSQLDEVMLQHELSRLVDAELVYQRGLPPQATYMFKHALIQDTAYESLLRSTRQGYHRRIGEVLEEQFPATTETQPELLAHHYTEAGMNEQAISYWLKSGQHAIQHSAHKEAIAYLTHGLELLTLLPETPERSSHELTLLLALGTPLQATKGYSDPERKHIFTRAWELCQQTSDTSEHFPVLFGLWQCYSMGAELETALAIGRQLYNLADHQYDSGLLLEAHRGLGFTQLSIGDYASAHAHAEQGIALYAPHQHHTHVVLYGQDPGMTCYIWLAATLWALGYPDQALERSNEALRIAQERSHPYSVVFALGWGARLRQYRRDVLATHEQAMTTVARCTEQGFAFWLTVGTILQGWVLVEQGEIEEGIAQLSQGLADFQTTGTELWRPYFLALLAEAWGKMGRTEEGLSVLTEALALVNKTGERAWEAELYRLQGILLLGQTQPNVSQGEGCFHQALDIACRQQTKSLELRAATGLARLWQSQDKREEARELLSPIYSWFTEGHDTADLIDAKTLLDELSEGSS